MWQGGSKGLAKHLLSRHEERRDTWTALRTVTCMCDIEMHDSTRCPFDAVTAGLCLIHRLRQIEGYSEAEMGIAFGTDRSELRRLEAKPPCRSVNSDGVACPEPARTRGWCIGHYARVCRGWTAEEMKIPLGEARPRPAKALRFCQELMHTGERCGRPTAMTLCRTHYDRAHRGWPPERMGEAIRERSSS